VKAWSLMCRPSPPHDPFERPLPEPVVALPEFEVDSPVGHRVRGVDEDAPFAVRAADYQRVSSVLHPDDDFSVRFGNELIVLGLVTETGFAEPFMDLTREKGNVKQVNITPLFEWTGSVCYFDPTNYCYNELDEYICSDKYYLYRLSLNWLLFVQFLDHR